MGIRTRVLEPSTFHWAAISAIERKSQYAPGGGAKQSPTTDEERKYGPFSLLRVRIETGRTHQIRVHLAQLGYPVVGDTLYGGNRFRNLNDPLLRTATRELDRQFLHAERLEFRHPRTQAILSFTAPLPPELSSFLNLAEGKMTETGGARGKLP